MNRIFYINKSDRMMAVVLLIVLTSVSAGIMFWGTSGDDAANPHAVSYDKRNGADKHRGNRRSTPYYNMAVKQGELFAFDPNTADSTALLRLGLKPWQVRNVYKYRAKGGIYRRPSDFARLYGLTVGQYKRLEPYIHISADYLPASSLVEDEDRKTFVRDTLKYPVKISEGEHIALNTADTASLKKVPGIGSGYARAIVSYRNRLGGFSSVSQLLEIDGFPDTSLKYFVLGSTPLNKINLNKLTLNQLRRHPYINFYQAKAIIDYRRLHGNLKSLHDLHLSRDFPPEAISRLEPYVVF